MAEEKNTNDFAKGQTLLFDYYQRTVGTPMEMPYYELMIYTYDDDDLLLEQYTQGGTRYEYVKSFLIPLSVSKEVMEAVNKFEMDKWNGRKGIPITGGMYVCRFRKGDSLIRVSSDNMPENGFAAFHAFESAMAAYIKDEYLVGERYSNGDPNEGYNIIKDRKQLKSFLKIVSVNRLNAKRYFELTSGMGQICPDRSYAPKVNYYLTAYLKAGYFLCDGFLMEITFTKRRSGTESEGEAVINGDTLWYPEDYGERLVCRPISFDDELTTFKNIRIKSVKGAIAKPAISREYVYEDDKGEFFYYKDIFNRYYLDGRMGEVIGEDNVYIDNRKRWFTE